MRKINITKTIGAATLVSAMFCASCTGNFEDLNTHPTDAYDDQMTEIEKVGSVFSCHDLSAESSTGKQ